MKVANFNTIKPESIQSILSPVPPLCRLKNKMKIKIDGMCKRVKAGYDLNYP